MQELDYIVCSHPHKDHIGGLSGALNYAKVQMAFCPVKKYDSKGFENFKKYLDKQGVHITVPEKLSAPFGYKNVRKNRTLT